MPSPGVRLSVTFVDHVKTNKDIFEIFSLGSHAILFFFHTKRGGAIPTGGWNPPNGGVECKGAMKK